MRAELKWMHSPDVYDLESCQPQGPFGILVQMMIGPKDLPGEESFDTIVCSHDWLVEQPAAKYVIGDHQIVLKEYDYQKLYHQVQSFCWSLDESSWRDLALKLDKSGRWEFADYVDYSV